MFKKITACLFAVFVMLSVFTVSVSAGSSGAEHGGSSGSFGTKSWKADMWYKFFGNKNINEDGKYKKYADDIIRAKGLTVNDSFGWFFSGGEVLDGKTGGISIWVTDGKFVLSNYNSGGNKWIGVRVVNSTYCYEFTLWANGEFYLSNTNSISYYASMIYNDFTGIDAPDCTKYQCSDIYKSLLTYLNSGNYDFNPVVPPAGFSKNAIKYSNFLDCPYGKYGAEPYENETDNYVTSGLFTDLDLYYSSKFIKGTSSTDHNEDITFYIPAVDIKTLQLLYKDVNIDWSSFFTSAIGASSSSFDFSSWYKKWYLHEDNPAIDNINWDTFFEKHFRSVHYEKDSFTPLDFFNDVYNKKYTSFNDFVKLKSIKGKLYIVFTMSSKYSVTHTGVGTVPGGGSNLGNDNAVFTGTRVTHTATRFDPKTGEVGKNKDGLGSDISQADDSLSRPPTKDELADLGFDYGYPNTQGDFPYILTMYRNGVEYFKMYFSKKPSVTSDYYSDKCIKYGFNVDNMKIYMYFKEQNMSRLFDFTNKENFTRENNPYWEDSSFVGKDITDTTLKILSNLMNIDTSEFSNTYTLYAWTNYTGEFPENYNGFYCKFNWDLEKSGHFQKNNSDDNYDYSQDYEPDKGVKDNNGNTHGGAVEKPTEAPSYNGFNNSDFQFDENNLWNYATSFLNFCAKAFLILPAFIWQLIACSIVIIIILRIAGR